LNERIVHLVRHGEVENPTGVTYGRLPGFSLSTAGRAQAERAAAELARLVEGPVVIYASPLERARESAEILRAALSPDASVTLDPRLIESGSWREGLPRSLDLRRYLERLAQADARLKSEPLRDVALRMKSAVLDALAASPDATPVIVSHQLPIWMSRVAFEHRVATADEPLWVRLFPLAFARGRLGPASITSLTFRGDELVGASYWDSNRGREGGRGR
jgi:broad specificity phosphatase PhoE